METKELVASIVSSVAWPTTTITIVFLMKNELSSLFSSVDRITYKDSEIRFQAIENNLSDLHVPIPDSHNDDIANKISKKNNDLKHARHVMNKSVSKSVSIASDVATMAYSDLEAKISLLGRSSLAIKFDERHDENLNDFLRDLKDRMIESVGLLESARPFRSFLINHFAQATRVAQAYINVVDQYADAVYRLENVLINISNEKPGETPS